MEKESHQAVGIDFGTTYSRVAVFHENPGKAILIQDKLRKSRASFSCVAFTETGVLIGDEAYYQLLNNPDNTIFDTKRILGKKFSDPSLQNDMEQWPFKVVAGADDRPMIVAQRQGKETHFTAEEIAGQMIRHMLETADDHLDSDVKDVVLAVSVFFSKLELRAIYEAAIKAGVVGVAIVSEPTAVALAYHACRKWSLDKILMIFDMSSRHLQISLVTVEHATVVVKATAGDSNLGGEQFVSRMVDHCISEFNRKSKSDISGNWRAVTRLRNACHDAMRKLCSKSTTDIAIDCLNYDRDFHISFSRSLVKLLTEDLCTKCMGHVSTVLLGGQIDKRDVYKVILVGGSSNIPGIKKSLKKMVGRKICSDIKPEHVVAYGAAVQAAIMTGKKTVKGIKGASCQS